MTMKNLSIKKVFAACINIRKKHSSSIDIKDLPLKKKLLISFIVIVIISNLSGVVGGIFLIKTHSDYKYALVNYGFAQGDVGKLCIEIEHSNSLLRDTLLLNDKEELLKTKESLYNSLDKINSLIDAVNKTITSDEEKEILKKITHNLIAAKDKRQKLITFGLEGKKDEGAILLNSEVAPLMNEITNLTTELLQEKIDTANKLSDNLKVLQIIANISIIVSIFASAALTLFLTKYITKVITKPIYDMEKVAKEMSNGNLDVSIEVNSKDEIGKLAASFSQMVTIIKGYINDISNVLGSISHGDLSVSTKEDYKGNFVEIKYSLDNILKSLREVFSEIKEATIQVNSGADQVASTSQVLSQGATDQASSVQELSASIEEINEQIKNTAISANSTNNITMDLVKDIKNSNNRMKEMLLAMDNIEQSSKDISNIIKVITDIATETNLLALNAAIEAARAGESGKGFAVVAEEVRSLAFQSADAAKHTTMLIKDSIKAVNKGRELADNTARTLIELVDSVDKVTNVILDIDSSAKYQVNFIEQIHSGILEISDVVQSNSAIAEESAASSEELTVQAETLNKMIGYFKIE